MVGRCGVRGLYKEVVRMKCHAVGRGLCPWGEGGTMHVGVGGDYACGGRLCAGFFGILLQAIDDVNVRNKAWKLMYVFRWADCEF